MKNIDNHVESGFLMGLADNTRIIMYEADLNVSEYATYGGKIDGYGSWCENHLMNLDHPGKALLP